MNPFDLLMKEIRLRPGDPVHPSAGVPMKQRKAAAGRVHRIQDDEPPAPRTAAPKPQEQPMAYEPKGKVAALADAMRSDPGRIWSSTDVAKVMEVQQGAVSAMLDAAIRNGAIYRRLDNGRCQYALRPFLPAATPAPSPAPRIPVIGKDLKPATLTPQHGDETTRQAPPPAPTTPPAPAPEPDPVAEGSEEVVEFNAALWADGQLTMVGVTHTEDGGIVLDADQTRKLCRLLHGQGPEA